MTPQPTSDRISGNLAMQPLMRWVASFDYVFGFQLKLLRDYFGVSEDRDRR